MDEEISWDRWKEQQRKYTGVEKKESILSRIKRIFRKIFKK